LMATSPFENHTLLGKSSWGKSTSLLCPDGYLPVLRLPVLRLALLRLAMLGLMVTARALFRAFF